jgi:hypothetical protein
MLVSHVRSTAMMSLFMRTTSSSGPQAAMPMLQPRVKPRLRPLRMSVTQSSPDSHSTVPSVLPLSTTITRQRGCSVRSRSASRHCLVKASAFHVRMTMATRRRSVPSALISRAAWPS